MEEKEQKKVLSLGDKKPKLELKKPVAVESAPARSSVRQSFSHGRSKTVAVEVKRKREASVSPAGGKAGRSFVHGPEPGTAVSVDERGKATSAVIRQLTQEEKEARLRALRGAVMEGAEQRRQIREAEEQAEPVSAGTAPPETAPVLSERERLRLRELEELRSIEETERAEKERRQKEEEQQRSLSGREVFAALGETGRMRGATRIGDLAGARALARRGLMLEDEAAEQPRRGKGGKGALAPRRGAEAERRRVGKITISRALSDEEETGRRRSLASVRRRIERSKRQAMQQQQEQVKISREIVVPEVITVQELANRMAERGSEVIKTLMKLGVMATITQSIDADTAELVAVEMGHRVKRVTEADVEAGLDTSADAPENMKPRPPVVTVMGHVDHGKTSLLDALRRTDVVAGEAGGITQHIGAYQVVLPKPLHGFDRITFIDTPGHAAFTEMRARGANVTDIVVLVVAADDGIKPQTIEAINHAKAAGAPIVVAINKCDLPTANPARVRQELLQHDIQVEEMGGETLSVEISAKTRQGLDKLQEAILLQAEILDLKANPDRPAEGTVVEARLEKGRGPVATVLMRRGTLKTGDIFVAGSEWGRVRATINDRGENVREAGPAMPVEVIGLNGTPVAGDDFIAVPTEARAREISEYRKRRRRSLAAAASKRSTLEQMMENIKSGDVKELAVLIKGDVHGSVEAIKNSLVKLSAESGEVRARVLDAAVGAITESDVTLAKASGGLIIGFNVRANPQAREMARRDGVEIRYYSVIYNVIDDVKQMLSGLLAPELRENLLGHAQVLQVFNISKIGKVAGCKVIDGVVKRGAKVRLLRDNVVIYEGSLKTLKRLKDEVKEVREGYECGMAFDNYDNIAVDDVIECFEIEEVARQL